MVYDVVIIGGGPAGLTAGVYAALSGMKTLIIEKSMCGGQAVLSNEFRNIPSYELIDGVSFGMKMINQVEKLNVEIKYEEVVRYEDFDKDIKKIITSSGTIETKSIILSMGAKARMLGVKDEQKYIGRGVGYCAVCDGALYKTKPMVVVGGGNTAFEDVNYLSGISDKIYMVHRSENFRANNTLINEIKELEREGKVTILTNSKVEAIVGDNHLEKVIVRNLLDDSTQELDVSAMFIAIGTVPETATVKDMINCDNSGHIITNEAMETNIKGVFAAGDIRQKALRQVVTACSDGAIAATNANGYIKSIK